MALLKADAGTARIAGLDVWAAVGGDQEAVSAICRANPPLDPNLTGGQILEYFAHLRGGVDQAYLKALIRRFDLDPSRQLPPVLQRQQAQSRCSFRRSCAAPAC